MAAQRELLQAVDAYLAEGQGMVEDNTLPTKPEAQVAPGAGGGAEECGSAPSASNAALLRHTVQLMQLVSDTLPSEMRQAATASILHKLSGKLLSTAPASLQAALLSPDASPELQSALQAATRCEEQAATQAPSTSSAPNPPQQAGTALDECKGSAESASQGSSEDILFAQQRSLRPALPALPPAVQVESAPLGAEQHIACDLRHFVRPRSAPCSAIAQLLEDPSLCGSMQRTTPASSPGSTAVQPRTSPDSPAGGAHDKRLQTHLQHRRQAKREGARQRLRGKKRLRAGATLPPSKKQAAIQQEAESEHASLQAQVGQQVRQPLDTCSTGASTAPVTARLTRSMRRRYLLAQRQRNKRLVPTPTPRLNRPLVCATPTVDDVFAFSTGSQAARARQRVYRRQVPPSR